MHPVALLPFLLLGLQEPPPWTGWEGVGTLLASVRVLSAEHVVLYAPDEKTGKLVPSGREELRLRIVTDRIGTVPLLVHRSKTPIETAEWDKDFSEFPKAAKQWTTRVRDTVPLLEKSEGMGLITDMDTLNSSFAVLKGERDKCSRLRKEGTTSILIRDPASFTTYDPLHLVKYYASSFEETRKAVDARLGKLDESMGKMRDPLIKVVPPYGNFDPFRPYPQEADRIRREYWTAVSEFACRYYEAYADYFAALSKKLAER